MELFVEQSHLVTNDSNFLVLLFNLNLKVLAVLLFGMQAIQNLPMKMVKNYLEINFESGLQYKVKVKFLTSFFIYNFHSLSDVM